MEMLMQNPNAIVTAEQLITHIWGWDTNVDTSVVWVHISNIRKKLEALAAPVAIKFVRNAGYIEDEDNTEHQGNDRQHRHGTYQNEFPLKSVNHTVASKIYPAPLTNLIATEAESPSSFLRILET